MAKTPKKDAKAKSDDKAVDENDLNIALDNDTPAPEAAPQSEAPQASGEPMLT
jgi:hypothetical protein